MRFTVVVELKAPREAVFDVLSDPRRRPEWQSSLESVHLKTEGAPGVGTTWYELVRGGLRFDLEITEHQRPSRWAERATGRFADARLGVDFEDAGAETTRVRVHVEIDFKGPAKLAAPFVRAAMPAALAADLRRVEGLAGVVPREGQR